MQLIAITCNYPSITRWTTISSQKCIFERKEIIISTCLGVILLHKSVITIFALLNKRSTMFVVHAICFVERYLDEPCKFLTSFNFSYYSICILTASFSSSQSDSLDIPKEVHRDSRSSCRLASSRSKVLLSSSLHLHDSFLRKNRLNDFADLEI